MSLKAQVVLVNVVVAACAAALTLDPIAIGASAAIALVANVALLRSRFEPIERLIAGMETADLADRDLRVPRAGGPTAGELERLTAAFERMLERLQDERRAAGRAVLRAQEEERQALAGDLHDEVNQSLTGLVLHLSVIEQMSDPELAPQVQQAKDIATQAMEELLTLARSLRPTALDDLGLIPALTTQVRDFGRRTGIEARFSKSGSPRPLTEEEQLVIYRVAQESLSNVAQHSGAHAVDVELSFTGQTVLRIADDGGGFDAGLAGGRPKGRRGSLGVAGMHERALLVGGRLAIFSRPGGRGTTVELTMTPGGAPA